jgi:Flp pilus assembly pilin Flp
VTRVAVLSRASLRKASQCGAASAEYAIVASLIAVVIVVAVTLVGQSVLGLFSIPGGL